MDNLSGIFQSGYVLALVFAALGSAFGTSTAGMAAIGAWKKCYMRDEPAPFILIVFVSAPLSQTIYGMILMNSILAAPDQISLATRFSTGLFGGLAIGVSSWFQGKAGAAASDALGETKQGLGNFIMVIGVVETVALFVMVFLTTALR